MSVVLDHWGQAMVFDRVTGEVHRLSVPTALENVERGQGRYLHGDTGERLEADPAGEPEIVEDAPIELKEDGVLDLPAGEDAAAPAEPPVPRPRPRPKSRPRAKK